MWAVSNPLCKIDKLSFICIIYIWMLWGACGVWAILNIQCEKLSTNNIFKPKAISNMFEFIIVKLKFIIFLPLGSSLEFGMFVNYDYDILMYIFPSSLH